MNEVVSVTYEEHSKRFRQAWTIGRKQAQIAHIALNDMIRSLHKEHPDWSINKISQKIADDHTDLEGFSSRQIQRELDNENRELVQENRPTGDKPKTRKKETEKNDSRSQDQTEDEKRFNEQLEQDVPVTQVVDLKRKLPVEQTVAKGEQAQDSDDLPPEMQAIAAKQIEPTNPLDIAVVGRYGLFDIKKTTEVLVRDLAKLKSSGWKVVEITARHIS